MCLKSVETSNDFDPMLHQLVSDAQVTIYQNIWFHVDKMSSAHVYVRLHNGQTIDDISEGLLEDCAQLVKVNSIQDKILACNKVNNIEVVYTPWSNLKKTTYIRMLAKLVSTIRRW
ncbi:hypothetical protein G4B88_005261 [Cannabis sativa]|uniref:NFACT RNA-binding domain-containing protein n=1 Tax=Cannabis sativa TaxID=3483 RepID=A0A7J6DLC7_CANSA|nr:hypothetical protein G4B88_005261 [Cannabis sativa]